MYQVVFDLLYSKLSSELSYSIFKLFDLVLPHGFKCSTVTWEGSRSSQIQSLMSLNHLTLVTSVVSHALSTVLCLGPFTASGTTCENTYWA